LRPKAAARAHGYTQNHLHYQGQLDAWSRKASSIEDKKDSMAVLVYMGVLRPGHKKLSLIGVSE